MKLLLPALLFFAITACSTKNSAKRIAQNDSIVDDSTIYQFVNEVMDTTVYRNGILVDKQSASIDFYLDSAMSKPIDSVISTEDLAVMKLQNKRAPSYRYKQEFIKNMKLIPSETVDTMEASTIGDFWSKFYTIYGTGFSTVSMPLFSRDRKTVIVDIDYSCGELCGNGGIYIFRKINNKWKQVGALSMWIS